MGWMFSMIYRFKTAYTLDFTPSRIWDELIDVESWPNHWKYFHRVEISGDDKTVRAGTRVECTVKALTFYTINFDAQILSCDPGSRLEVLSSGDLEGKGVWTLTETARGTESEFLWEVEPRSGLITFIEKIPFGRKLLEFNHSVMMEHGYRSFIRRLG